MLEHKGIGSAPDDVGRHKSAYDCAECDDMPHSSDKGKFLGNAIATCQTTNHDLPPTDT